MGSNAIALGIQAPPPVAGPLDLYKEGQSVQSLINQQALQKQQQQSNAISMQQQQIQLQQQQRAQKDAEIFNKSFHDNNGDWNSAIADATKNGASGQFITQAQMHRADQVTKFATADKDTLANEQTRLDSHAKDALKLLDTPPEDRPQAWAQLRNGHLATGAYKASDISEQAPTEDQLKSTVAQSKAAQDMLKEAATLRETNAKLPGEQAEARGKQLGTAAQTMGGATNQLAWTARRNMVVANDKSLAELIPEQYSPEAAQAVNQLGIPPEKVATTATERVELNDFMKHPPKGYQGTPVDFARWKASLVPAISNFYQSGGGMGVPGQGGGPGGAAQAANGGGAAPTTPAVDSTKAPGGWVSPNNFTLNNVPPNLRGQVQQILDYRAADPTGQARGAVPQAIKQWVNELDPQHDATTFPSRNKILTEYVKDASSGDLGAINTALGHLGELNTAAKALSSNDLPLLHSIASKVGAATGGDAETTYKAILHRVGPEMTSAYVKGGGGQAERGANEEDFDLSKGAKQIQSNIAESAMLLNSKLDSKRNNWDNTFKPYRDADKFDNRFITPSARATLNTLSAQAPTNKANATATSGPPAGATHTGVSSVDHKTYWLDANGKKLGPA